jgi:hypothetical protein
MKRCLISLFLLMIFAITALAQTSRGTVSGTVTDTNGGVIAGAEITLTNIGTTVT